MESIAREMPGSQVSIVPATWRDLNALRRLEQVCFPQDAWPLLDLVGALTLPNVLRLKAVVGGEMVGFVGVDIRPGRREAWIATIGVLPEHRGCRIGEALMLAVEEQLQVPRIRLSVRFSNASAIRLYRRLGYVQIDIWRRYYADGEDGLVFEKLF